MLIFWTPFLSTGCLAMLRPLSRLTATENSKRRWLKLAFNIADCVRAAISLLTRRRVSKSFSGRCAAMCAVSSGGTRRRSLWVFAMMSGVGAAMMSRMCS